MNVTVRNIEEKDRYAVELVAKRAFWNLYMPGCDEHYFIHTLRSHKDFIPELSFVIELEGRIIGSVMYTRSRLIDEKSNEKHTVTMGPLCVLPEYQRRGFGKALLEHTFRLAADMGYDTVINFGNPDNYVARGYKSCRRYNVCFEGDIFPAALLVKVLKDDALDGRKWFYHPSDADHTCEDTEALESFDALFPPKIKGWQPSQEEFYIHSHSVINRK